MNLTKQTIQTVKEKLIAKLTGRRFTVISAIADGAISNFDTDCELECDWTDRSQEAIRVFEDSRISFSFGSWHYTFYVDQNTEFYFSYDSVKIYHTAPCGDRRIEWFKAQQYSDKEINNEIE